jgi:hypothetical protein
VVNIARLLTTWANPDDIFVENFGTTDVSPGQYHLYVYPYNGPESTCIGSPIKDLGLYTFFAGKTTFIGLYPVYIPSIRSTASINGVDSSIIIRNNSTTDTAKVITTLFYPGGDVKEQRTDYVNHEATITINPVDSFTGSAIVVSSQDISVAVTDSRQTLEAYAAYNGIINAQTEVHVPILHRNNSGWYNRVYIQNVGMSASTVTIHYYPALNGNSCVRSFDINQNGQYVIDTLSENCLGTTFIGSAYITASEPLAVVWEQYKSGSASIIMSDSGGGSANTIYSPLIQNYNSNWVSGVAVQNASSSTNSLTIYFRRLDGTICYTDIHSNVLSRYSAIRYPPPPECTTVLSGKITGGSLPVAANINQLLFNTSSATDYPAISAPGPKAYVPWINENTYWTPGIQILNVGSQATTVRIKWYFSDGTYFAQYTTSILNPNQAVTYLGVPYTNTFQGTAIVEALSVPNTPIAVIVNHLKSGSSGTDLVMTFIGDPR